MTPFLLLSIWVIVFAIGAIILLLLWPFIPVERVMRLFALKSKPVIGYKKATLLAPGHHFAGVTGKHYGPDDKASDLTYGFHAYSKLDDARLHNQEGNVLLEVLLYGAVQKRTKGYIASHQRVLQVIPYRCLGSSTCKFEPSGYSLYRASAYGLHMFCPKHMKTILSGNFLDKLGGLMGFYETVSKGSLSNLSKLHPWLIEHKIVVTSLSELKPTELKKPS